MHNKPPPYNTGKVKIGVNYTPPTPPLTHDEEQLQAVLLGIRPDWCVFIESAMIYAAVVFTLFSAIFFLSTRD